MWLGAAVAASACGATVEKAGGRERERLAAAADLNVALGELIARFGASHDVDVTVSYGSSGTFYAELLNQAPFDLFLSADLQYPNELVARGLTMPQTAFTYAVGRLIVWAPAGSSVEIEPDGDEALTAASIAHVAIANPEHAPYGPRRRRRAGVRRHLQSAAAEAGVRRECRAGDAVRTERRRRRRHSRPLPGARAEREGRTGFRDPLDHLPTHGPWWRHPEMGPPIPTPRGPCAGSLSADGRAILERWGIWSRRGCGRRAAIASAKAFALRRVTPVVARGL